MAKAMLAEQSISLTATVRVAGRSWPPNSAGTEMPIQPPSTSCLKASLKPVGVVTLPSAMARAAFAVADAIERGEHLFAELGRLAQHGLDHIGRGVGKARQIAVAVEVEDVVQQEQRIVHGGFVGRHQSLPASSAAPLTIR